MSEKICLPVIREIQLNMLDVIDSFCEKNDLNYSLAFGSLLGAIRHKGFIPWDDDVDVLMPRKDYEIFKREFNNDRYRVASFEKDDKYIYPFAKLVDSYTSLIENITQDTDIGVYIDVFPVDIFPSNKCHQYLFQLRKIIFNTIYNLKMVKVNNRRGFLKNLVLRFSHVLLFPISWRYLVKRIDSLSSKFNEKKYSMAGIIAPVDNRIREMVDKNIFENYVEVPFENRKVFVVKDYDTYLKALYGDYMKMPPLSQQVTHHESVVRWKAEHINQH